MSKVIAIVSGGLDSVTLAHQLCADGHQLHLLAFDYGQRHKRELAFARACAERLQAEFTLVDLSGLSILLKGSALTDDIAVPHGHYADKSMSVTIVPNRNAIFLSIAFAAAVSGDAQLVATGVHAGDHPIYPDCRPQFIEGFDAMQRVAIEGCGDPQLRLIAPFVHIAKHDIVAIGARLKVPFDQTWSCYEGGEMHCGQCGTCVERRLAFKEANVADPTEYEDREFAKKIAQNA